MPTVGKGRLSPIHGMRKGKTLWLRLSPSGPLADSLNVLSRLWVPIWMMSFIHLLFLLHKKPRLRDVLFCLGIFQLGTPFVCFNRGSPLSFSNIFSFCQTFICLLIWWCYLLSVLTIELYQLPLPDVMTSWVDLFLLPICCFSLLLTTFAYIHSSPIQNLKHGIIDLLLTTWNSTKLEKR